MCKIIGIDISKQTFDVCFKEKEVLEHQVCQNNLNGFKKLTGIVKSDDIVVMEASGPYYVCLANYLYGQGVKVSVINPLVVKRFGQMRFYRARTDGKDARVIMEYGELENDGLPLWRPEPKGVRSLKQIQTSIELLYKQLGQSKNQLSAFKSSGFMDKSVERALETAIQRLQKSISGLERQMLVICKTYYNESLELPKSIPCIGDKTAIMLIALTDDFTRFGHYGQLIAYVGPAPRVYESGTGAKGKGHICKMGKARIRKLLYMCSWTAKRYNKTCKAMYGGLKTKGKPERAIKIAIANKLLKQAFAIATSKQKYMEDYQTNSCF